MTHSFDPTILREYDIRGIVGSTLGEDDARAIGRGFGTRVRRNGSTPRAGFLRGDFGSGTSGMSGRLSGRIELYAISADPARRFSPRSTLSARCPTNT